MSVHRIYFDSNIFIYGLEHEGESGEKARECLRRAERRALDAVTSEIALAEVLLGAPAADAALYAALYAAYEDLLSGRAAVAVLPVTRSILLESARLDVPRKIGLIDAIHAATALHAGCDGLLTEDVRMPAPAALRRLTLTDLVSVP